MSTAVTSYSQEPGKTWPNITLPNFDKRAMDAESVAGIEFLAFAPLVRSENLQGWEEYARENQGWITKDWRYHKNPVNAGPITPNIHYSGPDAEEEVTEEGESVYDGLHFPLWQAAPVPHNASVINFDLFQHPDFHDKFTDGLEERKTLISGVVDIDYLLEKMTFKHHHDPQSVVFEPVLDDFTEDANITGFILVGLPWKYVLGDILPSGTSPVPDC